MIIDIAISTAPYLVPFAAGILVTSVSGLRRARRAVAVAPVRVEPELRAPPPEAKMEPAKPAEVAPHLPAAEMHEIMPVMERHGALRNMAPAKAAETLIKYLQTHKATGYYTSSEIDDAWEMCHQELHIHPIPFGTIRSELQTIPGVYVGRKQLAIEHPDIRRRTGNRRATLYHIPDKGRGVDSQGSARPGSLSEGVTSSGHGIGAAHSKSSGALCDKKKHSPSNPEVRQAVRAEMDEAA